MAATVEEQEEGNQIFCQCKVPQKDIVECFSYGRFRAPDSTKAKRLASHVLRSG